MSSLIINANALFIPLANKSVHTIVTSPPYYGLRDYGTATWQGGDSECKHYVSGDGLPGETNAGEKQQSNHGSMRVAKDVCPHCGAVRIDEQIGLEVTPDAYIANLVEVFRECKRILRDDGTLWVNIGDSYTSMKSRYNQKAQNLNGGKAQDNEFQGNKTDLYHHPELGLKDKDLIGIPWMLAFALRADGWYLRQDIIWAKPNPMPESVKDRCTKSHEYIFLLSKSAKYYYDFQAVLEPATGFDGRKDTLMKGSAKYANGFVPSEPAQTMAVKGHERWPNTVRGFKTKDQIADNQHHGKDINSYGLSGAGFKGHSGNYDADGNLLSHQQDGVPARNKRDVWTVTTKPYKGAHYATFNPELIKPCILAGAPAGGIVFDPFVGSGTTVATAVQLGRKGIGLDLSLKYLRENARERIYEQEMQPVISF